MDFPIYREVVGEHSIGSEGVVRAMLERMEKQM
jgi:hypothetical protein